MRQEKFSLLEHRSKSTAFTKKMKANITETSTRDDIYQLIAASEDRPVSL